MQRISFPPVLSATLSRDSCWITVLSLSPWFSSPDEPGGTISWMSPAGAGLSFCSAEEACFARRFGRYLAFSRSSTTRQRLVAESGRVSMIRTRSPTPHWFCSSCALSLLVRRRTLPYSPCFTRSSTETTTVLSILSLTTRPSRVLRYGRDLVDSDAVASVVPVVSVVVSGVRTLVSSLIRHRPVQFPSRQGSAGSRARARAPRCRCGRSHA